MHAPLCATSSLAIRLQGSILEGPICLAEHILSGGLSPRRALCLEGCFSVFFVFLSLSCLRGWINFLFTTRWSTPFI
jgi:hypothetical protein